jgi:hypothetical protein
LVPRTSSRAFSSGRVTSVSTKSAVLPLIAVRIEMTVDPYEDAAGPNELAQKIVRHASDERFTSRLAKNDSCEVRTAAMGSVRFERGYGEQPKGGSWPR